MLHNAQMHQLVMTLSAGRQQHQQQPARPSADELCRLLAVSCLLLSLYISDRACISGRGRATRTVVCLCVSVCERQRALTQIVDTVVS